MAVASDVKTKPVTKSVTRVAAGGTNWIVPAKVAVFLGGLYPLARIVLLGFTGGLGANPIEFITRSTGLWTLVFLCITLAVTPVRRLTGLNALLRFRRMLGLFAFFYVVLHFTTYVWFDKWFDVFAMLKDIVKRPFILVGFSAFVLLIPLAVTSPKAMVRKLGRRWQTLHKLIYPIAVLAILHFWWMQAGKQDLILPTFYGASEAVLLAWRVFVWRLSQITRARAVESIFDRNAHEKRATLERRRPLSCQSDQLKSARENRFACEQLLHFFAFTHSPGTFAIDHDFGGARARIVVRAHHEAVRTRREDRDQIALFDGEFPILAEPVAAFANRTDDVVELRFRRALFDGFHAMKCLIHRRTREVIHAGVDDGEIFLLARFQVLHARKQHARIADQRAARFEIHFAMTVPALIDMRQHRTHKFFDSWRRFIVVRNAEPTADIDVMNVRAVRFNLLDEVQQFVDGVEIRAHFGDLRTNMAVDADHVEIRHGRCLRVGRAGLGERHAELVRFQAR